MTNKIFLYSAKMDIKETRIMKLNKKIATIMTYRLIAILILSVVFPLELLGQSKWTKSYPNKLGHSVVATSDGGYAVFGNQASILGGGLRVLKIDQSGATEWEKIFKEYIGFEGIQTSDGGYLIIGSHETDDELRGYDLRVLKLNATGEEEWTNIYGGDDDKVGQNSDNATAVKEAPGGGYRISGCTDNEMFLLSIDATGKELWLKTDPGEGTAVANDLVVLPSGDIVVVGYTINKDKRPNEMQWRFNKAGEIINKVDYKGFKDATGHGYKNSFNSVVALPDGGYVTGGTRIPDENDYNKVDFRLQVFNKDGGVINTGTNGHSWASHDIAEQIIATKDGGFLLGGPTKANNEAHQLTWLVKTDSNYKKLWSKVIVMDGSAFSMFRSMTEASDGGYLISVSSGGTQVLIKTSSNGTYKNTRVLSQEVNQPFTLKQKKNSIEFYGASGSKTMGWLSLYSIEGTLLRQAAIAKNGFGSLNIRGLSRGAGVLSVKINKLSHFKPVLVNKY